MLVQQEHSVLESKLEHQGLNKCTLFPNKHTLRRSASPARRSSPVRHPPVCYTCSIDRFRAISFKFMLWCDRNSCLVKWDWGLQYCNLSKYNCNVFQCFPFISRIPFSLIYIGHEKGLNSHFVAYLCVYRDQMV